jgi:hypothetical protein
MRKIHPSTILLSIVIVLCLWHAITRGSELSPADRYVQQKLSAPGHRFFVRTFPITNAWVEITRVRGFQPGQTVHAIALLPKHGPSKFLPPLPPPVSPLDPKIVVPKLEPASFYTQIIVLAGERYGWVDTSLIGSNASVRAALLNDAEHRVYYQSLVGRVVNVEPLVIPALEQLKLP